MNRTLLSVLVVLVSVALTGCGERLPPGMPKLYPVSITIVQEGTPLAGAVVQLIPEDPAKIQWGPGGRTDESGVAVLRTNGPYKGAPLGKYKVVVTKSEVEPHPNPVPSGPGVTREQLARHMDIMRRLKAYNYVETQYGSATDTPLQVEITAKVKTYTLDAGKPIKKEVPRVR
jgi:hypothetical protein